MKTQISKMLFAFTLIIIGIFPSKTSKAQLQAGFDNYILKQMKDNHIPGLAVTVIRNGKTALSKGYGYADIDKNIPFTANTVNAEIASVSKTITATALMKLWEQGLFQLDDPINNYLPFVVTNPYFPNVQITFRMLLNHTSSLVDDNDFSNQLYTDYVIPGRAPSLHEFLSSWLVPGGSYYVDSLIFVREMPGSQYNYSNVGFALIGYLVEQVSGISFDQFCNQYIFQPLCMNHTGWHFSDTDTNAVSRPYQYHTSPPGKQVDYGLYEYPDYPDGQLKSTSIDLSRFLLMNMNYGILDGIRILDSATIALMRTIPFINYDDHTDIKSGYGFGWDYTEIYHNFFDASDTATNKEYWGHFGSDFGIATAMYHDITYNNGVVLLSNGEHGLGEILVYICDMFANTISTQSQTNLNCSYISTPCEQSITYWKNNSSQWELNAIPMKIGTKHFYTGLQTLDVLNLQVNGDASIVLAKALIAAKLNVARGSELSPIVLTINEAMNIIGQKRLPFNVPVSFSSSTGVRMLAIAATLNSYNSGAMNTVACSGNTLREEGETFNEMEPEIVSVFPNPVSNSTSISFSLKQTADVSIKIFDMNGRLIKTLADNIFEAGEHQIEFSAVKLNAGIYILTLQAGELIKKEKLVVTK